MTKETELFKRTIEKNPGLFEKDNQWYLENLLADCLKGKSSLIRPLDSIIHTYLSSIELGIFGELIQIQKETAADKEMLLYHFRKESQYSSDVCSEVIDFWFEVLSPEMRNKLYLNQVDKKLSDDASSLKKEKITFRSNPIIDNGVINVNCGVGNQDYGFRIMGLDIHRECNHEAASFYAVVFNYLQRLSVIDEKKNLPLSFVEFNKNSSMNLNFRNVYRLCILLLYLVRNNYMDSDNCLDVIYLGKKTEMDAALYVINDYLNALARLSKYDKDILIKTKSDSAGLRIGMEQSADIMISSLDKKNSNCSRDVWCSDNIIYRIDDSNKKFLYLFLKEILCNKEIFKKAEFLSGQFELICSLLNENDVSKRSSICIMPTGSGKSLVFYLISLLQPGAVIILSPTRLLIEDQKRNLLNLHGIDDVVGLDFDEDYQSFQLEHKFLYITPEVLQNQNLLNKLTMLNSNLSFSFIILDEVHCISNWGHDFRPPFLMVSKYLNEQLDRARVIGFTATANYTVIKDLMIQLKIDDPNQVYSPIRLDKEHIDFHFLACEDYPSMVKEVSDFLRIALKNNEKTLIFTKSIEESQTLLDHLDDLEDRCLIYSKDDQYSYIHFANGDMPVLIADDGFGIGINLPKVTNVIHFGIPLSKGIYVQEIGRAGRNGENSRSLVIYERLDKHPEDGKYLLRNSSIDDLLDVKRIDRKTDVMKAIDAIFGDITSRESFIQSTVKMYDLLEESPSINLKKDEIPFQEKCLYVLYALGILKNWYELKRDKKSDDVTFYGLSDTSLTISDLKKQASESILKLGTNSKALSRINRSKTKKDLIEAFVNWYFDSYISNHREQLLDMTDFLESYKSKSMNDISSPEISRRLSYYFSLSMVKVTELRDRYLSMNYQTIATNAINDKDDIVSNIQQLNQDNYDAKLDFYLFCNSVVSDHRLDIARWKRILKNVMDKNDMLDLMEAYNSIYHDMNDEERMETFILFHLELEQRYHMGKEFLEFVFRNNQEDIVYYSYLICEINRIYEEE